MTGKSRFDTKDLACFFCATIIGGGKGSNLRRRLFKHVVFSPHNLMTFHGLILWMCFPLFTFRLGKAI